MILRNPETHRLTPEGNSACAEVVQKVREIYNELRKDFNTEEVYYMISTAAHSCVMGEALANKNVTLKK